MIQEQPNLDLWDGGIVYSAVADSEDGIIVGGVFSLANGTVRGNLARFASDMSLDQSFSPLFNGPVLALARLPDNRILSAGLFSTVNGQPAQFLALLAPSGQPVFPGAPQVDNLVLAMRASQNGTHLYLGGNFTTVGGMARQRVARINADNLLVDTGWSGPSVEGGVVRTVYPDPNARLWVGGDFSVVGGNPASGLARLTSTGDLDLAFNVSGRVFSVDSDDDGNVYVCGGFSSIDGVPRTNVARILPTGQIDDSWVLEIDATAYDCSVNEGLLRIAGDFTSVGGFDVSGLASVDIASQTISDSGANFAGQYVGIVGGEHRILFARDFPSGLFVGGIFRTVNGLASPGGVLLSVDVRDQAQTFTFERQPEIRGVAFPLEDGGWLLGGSFRRVGGFLRDNLVRLRADGTVDETWDLPINGLLAAGHLTQSGELYLGGFFSKVGPLERNGLVRLANLNDAVVDSEWLPQIDPAGAVFAIATDRLGSSSVAVGGRFNSAGQAGGQAAARSNFAVFSSSMPGELLEFDVDLDGQVNAILQLNGPEFLLGGAFTTVNELPRNGLLKVNTDKGPLMSGVQTNGTVWALSYDEPDVIYLGGAFTAVGNQSRSRIAQVDRTLALQPWSVSANATVFDIELDELGFAYLGGAFTSINGTPRLQLGRVSRDVAGSVDAEFNVPVVGGQVWTLARRKDRLVVAGSFLQVAGLPRRAAAELRIATPLSDVIFQDRFFELASSREGQSVNPVSGVEGRELDCLAFMFVSESLGRGEFDLPSSSCL